MFGVVCGPYFDYALVAQPPKAFDGMSHKDINKTRKNKGEKYRSRKEHRQKYRI